MPVIRRKNKSKMRIKRKSNKSFNTRVIEALQITAEKKQAKLALNNGTLSNAITDSVGLYQIMPRINQGSGANGQRNGNEIQLKKIVLKGFISIPVASQTALGGGEFLGRIMILRSREFSANQVIFDPTSNFDYTSLMEYNQPYIGSPNNWLQSVNKNGFISRRDKRMRFHTQTNTQGNNTAPPNPDSIRFFSITITFGKQGKKLHYNSSTTSQTEDFPYFMCAAVATPTGIAVGGGAKLSYYSIAHYTDL